jgi:hypothetical protein
VAKRRLARGLPAGCKVAVHSGVLKKNVGGRLAGGDSKSRLDLCVQPGIRVGGATSGMRPREPEQLKRRVLSVIRLKRDGLCAETAGMSQPGDVGIPRLKSRSRKEIVFGCCCCRRRRQGSLKISRETRSSEARPGKLN